MALERIGPFHYRRHAPTLPPLNNDPGPDAAEARRHRVLIAGGGPVGLACALGLARQGIASVVIEADDSVCEGSRAACISRRSLEILDRLGCAGPFIDKGLAWTGGRSFYGTQEVFAFQMHSVPGDKYPPMINLEQYYIEQYLLDAIQAANARTPGLVDIRWASRIVGLASDHAGVQLDVENALGRYRVAADWLLACDGGQSFVRQRLGLELQGVAYQGRYAIVDIELASTHPTERRAWFDPPWARGTTILMHRQPDDIWRIDFQLAAGQDAAEVLAPEAVRRFVQTHLDAIGEGHLPWTPVWSSVYRAGAMTLAEYRHGRILFAGNAAHAMPIFGVRGLNSGFDDADNLVWKLAAVLNAGASEGLLDSYSTERVAAFHVNADNAMRSTEFMSPPNRGFELLREAALSLAGRHPGIARLVNPRQTHAITYQGSPLSSADEPFVQGPEPGAPWPDGPCPGGGFVSDRLSRRGFTLLCFDADELAQDVETGSIAADWDALPCDAVRLDAANALAQASGCGPGDAYLLRPDGHVAGRWHGARAATVLAAIRRACQRIDTPQATLQGGAA